MGYPATLAATLSGATVGQLAYWRKSTPEQGPLLVPEYGLRPRAVYSYRDIVALRMFVQLRGETSLQRIRKAVSWLQKRHPDTHLSAHRLRAHPGGRSIVWISADGDYFDVVEHPGQAGIRVVMDDIFRPFTTSAGWRVPDLAQPAPGVEVDPEIRGGYPVMEGTRIPFNVIASLAAEGLTVAEIVDLYPTVSPNAINGAVSFADLVRSSSRHQSAA